MDNKQILLDKIESREAKIGVVGMGYVGLPFAIAFAQKGFHVVGVDISEEKIALLNRGESYIEDVPSDEIGPLIKSGLLRASTDYKALTEVDAISICVPTPLSKKLKDPDVSFIIDAANRIARQAYDGKLIILESTTYPGTTEEVVLPRLSINGKKVGEDYFLAFSPERIDPGRTDFNMFNTPKVMGAVTADCLEVAVSLYDAVIEQIVPVSSTGAAEMVKLLENTFRAVNIGLVNEVALMCDRLGLDVWEVVAAAATKPYGFMPFYPGPGLGGHCIPVDPHYLSWKLRTLDYKARFIELASEINSYMPEYVVSKVSDALNMERKAINGSQIVILGVAYKPNVRDVRESPALDIIYLLRERGAEVKYVDPYVPHIATEGLDMHDDPLTEGILQQADCVVVVTNHTELDWDLVAEHARLVVDTRGIVKEVKHGRVIRL